MGSDHMVQGRHARKALVIFALLASGRPQSNAWGGYSYGSVADLGLGSIPLVLQKAALRIYTDQPLLLLVNLSSTKSVLKNNNN